jgi:hypothetical protein
MAHSSVRPDPDRDGWLRFSTALGWHWHGATATTAMTHIAIQEQLDGKTADWMEKVSDEQYQVVRQDNKRYG